MHAVNTHITVVEQLEGGVNPVRRGVRGPGNSAGVTGWRFESGSEVRGSPPTPTPTAEE